MHEMSKTIQKTALATQRKKSLYGPAVQKKSQSAAEFLKPCQKQPVQFFDRKNHEFWKKRPQPDNRDGLGDTEVNKPAAGQLQRDHIIPFAKISEFANIVFQTPPAGLAQTPQAVTARTERNTAGDDWLRAAGKNFRERAKAHTASRFYMGNVEAFGKISDDEQEAFIQNRDISESNFEEGEYMEMLSKAISWMPANIFMAPHPKAEDGKDGLDTTAEPVVGDKYPKYKEAYDNMEAVIQNPKKAKRRQKNDIQLDEMKTAALINLKEIAELRSEPWPFVETQWEYIGDKWKVKKNSSQDGTHAQEGESHVQEAGDHVQEGADHVGADTHVQEAEVHAQEDAAHAGADTGHMEEDT